MAAQHQEKPLFAHAEGCSFLAWRGKRGGGENNGHRRYQKLRQEAGSFGFEVEETGKGQPPSGRRRRLAPLPGAQANAGTLYPFQ